MKKSKILIAVITVIAAASAARAEGISIDFDRRNPTTISFMDFLRDSDSCQNNGVACAQSVPAAIPIMNSITAIEPEVQNNHTNAKQQSMRDIIAVYNDHRLHDESVKKTWGLTEF